MPNISNILADDHVRLAKISARDTMLQAAIATYNGIDYNGIDTHILLKRIVELEERLAIVQPDLLLQEKFPALYEAYREYKIIEKLTLGNNNET